MTYKLPGGKTTLSVKVYRNAWKEVANQLGCALGCEVICDWGHITLYNYRVSTDSLNMKNEAAEFLLQLVRKSDGLQLGGS